MSEVLHADIFFFITGIAVIILTFFLCIALVHLIKILKAVRRIIDRVEAGTETFSEDIERLRTYVVEESFMSRFFRSASRERGNNEESKVRKNAPKKQRSELRIKNENN